MLGLLWGDFATLDIDSELRMCRLNVSPWSPLRTHISNSMRKAGGGTIVQCGFGGRLPADPVLGDLRSSKSFVTAFSEAIAEENRAFGIQVLAFCRDRRNEFFCCLGDRPPIKVKGQKPVEEVVDAALYPYAAAGHGPARFSQQ